MLNDVLEGAPSFAFFSEGWALTFQRRDFSSSCSCCGRFFTLSKANGRSALFSPRLVLQGGRLCRVLPKPVIPTGGARFLRAAVEGSLRCLSSSPCPLCSLRSLCNPFLSYLPSLRNPCYIATAPPTFLKGEGNHRHEQNMQLHPRTSRDAICLIRRSRPGTHPSR